MSAKEDLLLYQIGITLIPGIGNITAKKLISYCGGIKEVFTERKAALLKIPGVGDSLAQIIVSQNVLNQAETEAKLIRKNNWNTLFFLDDDYPMRLKHCMDGPILLFTKGKSVLNQKHIISIVGTRKASDYGKKITDQLVNGLKDLDILIVSGLAYGIDICAHRTALKYGIPTACVLAHGLDSIYPSVHKKTAEEMMGTGALISEFKHGVKADRENFPQRNRIIAGMADATVVVEAGVKGGALITADIANSYSRDVFAIPGRIGDKVSEGCNWLIRTNRAALISSSKDIIHAMGWDTEKTPDNKTTQKKLFLDLSEDQQKIVDILNKNGKTAIDNLCLQAKMSMSKVASLLLDLEFSGVVISFPGKTYGLA